MQKTNTKDSDKSDVEGVSSTSSLLTKNDSAFELVTWPTFDSFQNQLSEKVFALQSTRISPKLEKSHNITELPFGNFNLGLHVNDNAKQVVANRNNLVQFINQTLQSDPLNESCPAEIEIQWLEQVHGNKVADVIAVDGIPIVADASVTRQKNIALAIMTADCLPILLSHKSGNEVAAIHGGWRPLAGSIIKETLDTMHSKPEEVVAWLGPCIGNEAFEVGVEVKNIFIKQGDSFSTAFVKQANGQYLADLHQIAQMQLQSLGVTAISMLEECTYQNTSKYYSYRKEQVTGRMATIICRR